jgi:hypothetical protein
MEVIMKKDIVPLNDQVLTGMSIEELEDRLEMQVLGVPVENALAEGSVIIIDCDCIIIVRVPIEI